jgi:PAS domain-containing protein
LGGLGFLSSCKQLKPNRRWHEANLRLAIEAAGVALWSWNVDNDKLTMDEGGYHLWGVPISEFVTFEDLSAHIHPADRDRVRAAFAATRAISDAFEIEFRIILGNEIRWIQAAARERRAGSCLAYSST